LIYFIGCPTHVAVGTDLFEVMISGLYGTATYTYKGRTELVAAMIMLCGAAVGAQIGTVATKYIKGYGIRIAFGLAVIGCGLSILLKMMAKWFPAWGFTFDTSATVLILGLVAAMSLYIGIQMVIGAKAEVRARKAQIAAAK
jgi:drug/metabolite transporter (DMT)-like permease